MAGSLERLEQSLTAALEEVRVFRKGPAAFDADVLGLLLDSLPTGMRIKVTVQDSTGFIYEGIVTEMSEGRIDVRAFDGEYVSDLDPGQILRARLVVAR